MSDTMDILITILEKLEDIIQIQALDFQMKYGFFPLPEEESELLPEPGDDDERHASGNIAPKNPYH